MTYHRNLINRAEKVMQTWVNGNRTDALNAISETANPFDAAFLAMQISDSLPIEYEADIECEADWANAIERKSFEYD